jgi:cell division protein FtsQ
MDLSLPSLPIALRVGHRVPWRAAIGALLAAALLAVGWLWLRDSQLLAVRQVRISGLHGPQAAQIEARLRIAARRMTTMDFNSAALRAAVADFPVVKALQVSTGFPHAVRIRVIERPAIATLLAGGEHTALAADGTALGTQLASSSLPLLSGSLAPLPGQRVSDGEVRAAVSVLAAAPATLARYVARVYSSPEGLTVVMRNGLLVYFGDASRPRAKWLSLASVLADPGSSGARYVDVRVPERPAAGLSAAGLTPLRPGGASSPSATLAERLEQGVGGASASTSAPGEASAAAPSERSEGAAASSATGREGPASNPTGAGEAPSSHGEAPSSHAHESPATASENAPSPQATGGASAAYPKG